MSVLEADRASIVRLEAQIFDLQRSTERLILELRAQQAVVQRRIDSYKYPVLTLPNEMVTAIFLHFSPIYYPHCRHRIGGFSTRLLTQICRRWREVALAMPDLWRAIYFTDPGASGIRLEQQHHLAHLWLTWSQHRPPPLEIEMRMEPSQSLPSSYLIACAWSL
ncbi:hypothetical protein K438DRAFT_1987572 [Mycena galopus ATCC 62051]|nr:hypothetical protein K438DRAFT_1987572 [Mycena galopus ATCC 62051]